MFDVETFVRGCLADLARPDRVAALHARLAAAIARPDDLRAAFADMTGEEALIHRCDRLTVVHVRLSPNVAFPPHNHHMDALIGAYEGGEVHRVYARAGAGLVLTREFALRTGEVAVCAGPEIHAVANPADVRSAALHIYCGDLVATRRQVWRADFSECADYSDDRYFAWAEPFDPTRPFDRPAVCHAHAEGAP